MPGPDNPEPFYCTQSIIKELQQAKQINPHAPYSIRYDAQNRPYACGKLPRLLMKIQDPAIKHLSFTKNESYYRADDIAKELGVDPQAKLPKGATKADKMQYYLNQAKIKDEQQLRKKMCNTINNIKVADIPCKCNNKPVFEQLFPNATTNGDAMSYSSCKHTIFAAAKRQIKAAPTPDLAVTEEFLNFARKTIDKEIGEDLDHFGYSFNQWYNHLPKKKQVLMDKIVNAITRRDNTLLSSKDMKRLFEWDAEMQSLNAHYTGICKVEVQALDGKPRMVCSIPDLIKFTMGAVTWQLEEICSKKLRGYCGGKNLDEMSDMVNEYIAKGFTRVVEGDGSAFDNSQDVMLKEIDRYIYRRVARSVYHTHGADKWKDLFLRFSQAMYKTMEIQYVDPHRKKKKTLITYSVLGTVFSGDCDTTLANTIRMALYNRFAFERKGYRYNHDYIAFSKGDDFTVMFNPTHLTDDQVKALYWEIFLHKPEGEDEQYDNRRHGIGQICKFLEFGPPDIIKFCSLRAWYINKSETKIRLTRDPAKFLTLSKYSRKTKTLDAQRKIIYLYDQALALEQSYKGLQYFDTMALCYRTQAEALRIRYKINKARMRKIYLDYKAKRKQGESRLHLDDEDPTTNEYVAFRQHVFKIDSDGYWETMKRIEKASTRIYTPEQNEIANMYINAEFDSWELKHLLAPNKIYAKQDQTPQYQ